MKFIIHIAVLLFHVPMLAQVISHEGLIFDGANYDVVMVRLSDEAFEKFEIVENEGYFNHARFVSDPSADSILFAVNASISGQGCKPLGYLAKDGVQLEAANLADGDGNFYLKPNGALLISNSEAAIVESSRINRFKDVQLGIQSGPMLVIEDKIHPVFNPDSRNRNYRCGVGIYRDSSGQDWMVFAISNEPVRFYDFAALFKERFNCKNALCLESAGCAMKLPYLNDNSGRKDHTICNYLVYMR